MVGVPFLVNRCEAGPSARIGWPLPCLKRNAEMITGLTLVGAGGEDSPAVEAAPGCADLTRAQREFREALAASWSGQPEDRRRLLEVLKRATAEILGKKQAG